MTTFDRLINHFRKMVKFKMGIANISKEDLCRKLAISRSYLNKVLNGKCNSISLGMMCSMADVLGIELGLINFSSHKDHEPKEESIFAYEGELPHQVLIRVAMEIPKDPNLEAGIYKGFKRKNPIVDLAGNQKKR